MILLGRRNKYKNLQGKEHFTKSVGHALDGIEYTINHERNIKIQILFGIIVCIAGFLFKISIIEWIILILVISQVLALELINTAIERCVDLASKDYHELAKASKDVAAGAVLVMSMFASIIGILIFLPKIINIIR